MEVKRSRTMSKKTDMPKVGGNSISAKFVKRPIVKVIAGLGISLAVIAGIVTVTFVGINLDKKLNPDHEVDQNAIQPSVDNIKGDDPTDDTGADLVEPSDDPEQKWDDVFDEGYDPTKPVPPEGEEEEEQESKEDSTATPPTTNDEGLAANNGNSNEVDIEYNDPSYHVWYDSDRVF